MWNNFLHLHICQEFPPHLELHVQLNAESVFDMFVFVNFKNIKGKLKVFFSFYLQWDLVCDDSWLVDLLSTILIAGFGVGALSTGEISDRYIR